VSSQARIFQLKIVILNTEPLLWRRILVPENYSLGNIHLIVQSAVGFDNCHQHEFSFDNPTFGQTVQDAPDYLQNEESVLISTVFAEPDYGLGYRYNFHDNWEHEIRLEKVFEPNPDFSSPICIEGEGAGPLEEIGGYDQYNHMIKTFSEPSAVSAIGKLDEDTVKKPKEDYEPELFVIGDVNERLRIWDTWDWSDDLDMDEDEETPIENDLDFDETENVTLDDEDMELDEELSMEDDTNLDLDDEEDLELDEAEDLELDEDVNLEDDINIEGDLDTEDDA
jgi:hypothetical protein